MTEGTWRGNGRKIGLSPLHCHQGFMIIHFVQLCATMECYIRTTVPMRSWCTSKCWSCNKEGLMGDMLFCGGHGSATSNRTPKFLGNLRPWRWIPPPKNMRIALRCKLQSKPGRDFIHAESKAVQQSIEVLRYVNLTVIANRTAAAPAVFKKLSAVQILACPSMCWILLPVVRRRSFNFDQTTWTVNVACMQRWEVEAKCICCWELSLFFTVNYVSAPSKNHVQREKSNSGSEWPMNWGSFPPMKRSKKWLIRRTGMWIAESTTRNSCRLWRNKPVSVEMWIPHEVLRLYEIRRWDSI